MKKTGCLRGIWSGQVSQFRSGGERTEPNTAALENPHNYTSLGGAGGSPLPGSSARTCRPWDLAVGMQMCNIWLSLQKHPCDRRYEHNPASVLSSH